MPSSRQSRINSKNVKVGEISSKPQPEIRFIENKPGKKTNVSKASKASPAIGYFIPTNATGKLPQKSQTLTRRSDRTVTSKKKK
jgi:hypothetical protein